MIPMEQVVSDKAESVVDLIIRVRQKVHHELVMNGYNHANKAAHLAVKAALSEVSLEGIRADHLYEQIKQTPRSGVYILDGNLLVSRGHCLIFMDGSDVPEPDEDNPLDRFNVTATWTEKPGEKFLDEMQRIQLARHELYAVAMSEAALRLHEKGYKGQWRITIKSVSYPRKY